MALFKLPLSGDVVQWINPVTWFASGNQISTNVYLGESPETEAENPRPGRHLWKAARANH